MCWWSTYIWMNENISLYCPNNILLWSVYMLLPCHTNLRKLFFVIKNLLSSPIKKIVWISKIKMFNLYWCHNFTNEVATNNMFVGQLTTSNLYNPLNLLLTFLTITFLGFIGCYNPTFFWTKHHNTPFICQCSYWQQVFCHFKYKECIIKKINPSMHAFDKIDL